MDAHAWMAFAAALLVALAVPGPDLVLVVHSASHSAREGARTAAGIVAGLTLHAGLAAAGATALLLSAPGALTVAQLLGAGVLLWMGGGMLRAAGAASARGTATHGTAGGFRRGLITNATNPKALLFFAAVLPSFIGGGEDAQWRTIVLCATVVLGAGAWWGVAIAVVRRIGVHRSPTADRMVTRLGGVALLIISAGLLAGTIGTVLDWERSALWNTEHSGTTSTLEQRTEETPEPSPGPGPATEEGDTMRPTRIAGAGAGGVVS